MPRDSRSRKSLHPPSPWTGRGPPDRMRRILLRFLGRSVLSPTHAPGRLPAVVQQGVRPRRDRLHFLHDPIPGHDPIVARFRPRGVPLRREVPPVHHARTGTPPDAGGARALLSFDRRPPAQGRGPRGPAPSVPPVRRRPGAIAVLPRRRAAGLPVRGRVPPRLL